MPIWSGILDELRKAPQPGLDTVRRKYLSKLYNHTQRNTILYASSWVQHPEYPPDTMSINDEDIQAFMEVSNGLGGEDLDLILHSPGGSPEAAEAIVSYLRSRFTDIRIIVPQQAMSAATMIACAANQIVLGKHSFLGPADPQMVIQTQLGTRMVPAQAILDQFDRAQREIAEDSEKLAVWLPILPQYGPAFLAQCEAVLEMSKKIVTTWLRTYMFMEDENPSKKAEEVSDWLTNHKHFKSHNRHIARVDVESQGLPVVRLEEDEILQDLALSIFHATTLMFSSTTVPKIVESHTGRAFIKHINIHPSPPSG